MPKRKQPLNGLYVFNFTRLKRPDFIGTDNFSDSQIGSYFAPEALGAWLLHALRDRIKLPGPSGHADMEVVSITVRTRKKERHEPQPRPTE